MTLSKSQFTRTDHSVEMSGSSQVGYHILVADKQNNANLLDYKRTKSRIVVKSVLGAETFCLTDACDTSIIIQHDLRPMLNDKRKISKLSEIATFLTVLIINAFRTEERLMIYIKEAREAHNDGIFDDIISIRREYNVSDRMTKSTILPEFFNKIIHGIIHYEVEL